MPDLDYSLDTIQADRCHYVVHKGERVLIPGCMGAAVYGEPGCTCGPAPGSYDELRALVENLDDRLRRAGRADLDRQRQIRELRERLTRLETFLTPSKDT